jgi:hypothetical protein
MTQTFFDILMHVPFAIQQVGFEEIEMIGPEIIQLA